MYRDQSLTTALAFVFWVGIALVLVVRIDFVWTRNNGEEDRTRF